MQLVTNGSVHSGFVLCYHCFPAQHPVYCRCSRVHSAGKWDAGSASSCQHSMQCTLQHSLLLPYCACQAPNSQQPCEYLAATRLFLQVKYFQAKANQGGQHSDF